MKVLAALALVVLVCMVGCHKAPPPPELDKDTRFIRLVLKPSLDRHEYIDDISNGLGREICGQKRDPPIPECPEVLAKLPPREQVPHLLRKGEFPKSKSTDENPNPGTGNDH